VGGLSFDDIAPTYDFLNHLLSLGCDFAWRRRVARFLAQCRPAKVVDLATGTGDLAIALLQQGCGAEELVGLDISEPMLAIARRKVERRGYAERIRFTCDDATRTTLPDSSFDAVTMAFGIRNTPDAAGTLEEIYRLLAPAGTAVILEFSLPANRLVRAGYLAYLRLVVPLIGGLISRNRQAYRYLDTSIEGFHQPAEFCRTMETAGFADIQAATLTLGVATMYSGSKR
jgi:demethylmenaquinone methyltransferase/2-methoxy-6-polyprenyl-1,4-benzoquinol methylase